MSLSLSRSFSPAVERVDRDSPRQVRLQQEAVAAMPLLQPSLDALSEPVVILNEHRQVVAANRHLLEMLRQPLPAVVGRRPGEIIGCCHACGGPDGCGTAPACQACGALQAVTTSQRTLVPVTRECRLSLSYPAGASLDLQVTATPVVIDSQGFTIAVLKNIGDQKRLAVLSRMFFHDVLNTAGGIQGYVELLEQQLPPGTEESAELAELHDLTAQLVEEIRVQRDLTYAEAGELDVRWSEIDLEVCCVRLANWLRRHPVAQGREIVVERTATGAVVSDETLLGRVLGNMLKNALEAIPRGERVTLVCRPAGAQVVFEVHNPGVMPPLVQLQVFQRSFSTKGATGRGIGTHSMKLFGERYLQGRVSFTSRESDGTTFRLMIPRQPQDAPTRRDKSDARRGTPAAAASARAPVG